MKTNKICSIFFLIIALFTACTPAPAPTPNPNKVPNPKNHPRHTPTPNVYTDIDHDGLSDQNEAKIGLNPNSNDSDEDGLTDYDEITKYYTDPANPDSDNDGLLDSEWNERQEHTSTLYVKMRIITPFNTESMNDHFQDINVIEENKNNLLFELIFYPDSYHIVEELPFGSIDYTTQNFQKFLEPDPLMNFDDEMTSMVQGEIYSNSQDLSDLDVLESMFRWEKGRVKMMPGTTDKSKPYPEPFLDIEITEEDEITFPSTPIMFSGKPREPEYSQFYSDELHNREWQMENIILGKEMFLNKSHGSCGSTANFHSTILRSIGIPTRIIQTVPVVNTSSTSQMKLLDELPNNVKSSLLSQMGYNHFLVEAFIGGRWIRVNNNTYEDRFEMRGAFIKIIEFDSWKNVSFARTWGYNRPYELIEIDYNEPIHKSYIHNLN